MRRHLGGEQVKAGFYLDLAGWEIQTISGRDGGQLEGDSSRRYVRLPALGMLVFAPLMGAAFAVFLPFIGMAIALEYLGQKAWAAVWRRTPRAIRNE